MNANSGHPVAAAVDKYTGFARLVAFLCRLGLLQQQRLQEQRSLSNLNPPQPLEYVSVSAWAPKKQ